MRFDPARAACLEVEWWRVHREAQHADGSGRSELTVALCDLYAYSYSVDPAAVHRAAALRAEAMQVSDRWVEGGCDPEDPRLAQERRLLAILRRAARLDLGGLRARAQCPVRLG